MANQIANGDFSSGDVGFTSGYSVVPANGTVQTGPGNIGLTTNPATGFTNGYNSSTDHSGNSGGLMLLVDGYYAGTNAWAETVSVAPSTIYTFTGWAASADPANVGVAGVFDNGSQVGTSFTAPATAGVWTEWTTSLTTGSGRSSIALAIQDLNPNAYSIGDDFSLDDLSLAASSPAPAPEPSTLVFATLALVSGLAVRSWRITIYEAICRVASQAINNCAHKAFMGW